MICSLDCGLLLCQNELCLEKDVFSFGENKDSNVKFTSFVNLYKLKFYFSLPLRVFKLFYFIFYFGLIVFNLGIWVIGFD